jgi:hypothetical protein
VERYTPRQGASSARLNPARAPGRIASLAGHVVGTLGQPGRGRHGSERRLRKWLTDDRVRASRQNSGARIPGDLHAERLTAAQGATAIATATRSGSVARRSQTERASRVDLDGARGALGLWADLCVVAEAGDDEQPDRFSPGAPMVSGVGVDSGQQMSQAYLNPTTDFGPTGSPFVR